MRRITRQSDGASAPLWFYRTSVIIGFPFWLPYVFLRELVTGIGRAFRYAWLDVLGEIATVRRHWNGGTIND